MQMTATNQTIIHAVASEGLLEAGARPNPPELEITTSNRLVITYGAIRDIDSANFVFSQGTGDYSDCWFGPNGEGPYSDLILTHPAT
ncbi:MAG: hypothetical protein JHD02_00290 [Thermoleophilaceae bacterium]|nr:hypothetical protein [Thermoleophilaceae bacterium]